MHTLTIVSGGFVLLALFCLVGWARGGNPGLARAALVFIPTWAFITLGNVAVGVLWAGYTVLQELPVLIVTFAIPAMVALFVARRYTKR